MKFVEQNLILKVVPEKSIDFPIHSIDQGGSLSIVDLQVQPGSGLVKLHFIEWKNDMYFIAKHLKCIRPYPKVKKSSG